MFLSEGIDGIIIPYTGAATILKNPVFFGANTSTPGSFNGGFSLSDFGGPGSFSGTTRNGVACVILQATYGNFISESDNMLNLVTGVLSSVTSQFGSFSGPTPTGAPLAQAIATTFPCYPKESPCKLNRQKNGLEQCAPGTDTYGALNSAKAPFRLDKPETGTVAENPYPVPVPYPA
jgi:hypothetical protein